MGSCAGSFGPQWGRVLRDCGTLKRWELTAGSYITRSLGCYPHKKLLQLSLVPMRMGRRKMNNPGL